MAERRVMRPAWRCNLSELLLDVDLSSNLDRPAVRQPDEVWTYSALAVSVGRLAGALSELGVGRGQRILLALPDSRLWVASFLAVTRIGAVAVLASPTLPRPRLREAALRARPDAAMTDDEDLCPSVPAFDMATLGQMAGTGFTDPGPAATRASDPAYLLLTSGSTGTAKWAIHRHGDIPACIATYGRHVLKLQPGDVTWSVAALATSYGLGNSLYFPLGAGASTWISGDPPSPADAARACDDGGANILFGVPTFWARVARHVADGRLDAKSFAGVRLAVSAGEPLPPPVWDQVQQVLGLELVDGLGSSEASNLYLSNRPGRARRDSVGVVLPGYDLRVLDDDGVDVGVGAPGELVVRGPTVMAGYLDADDATDRALRGGWLHTGDLVERRPDASFRFVGRIGERFKSGGSWVDPAGVEAVLCAQPAVAEVAVVVSADEAGIARVVAIVVPRNGVPNEVLRRRLERLSSDELARHEQPRRYVFVSELPTAASGKVRRSALSALVEHAGTENGSG